jgi:hypothetical protein
MDTYNITIYDSLNESIKSNDDNNSITPSRSSIRNPMYERIQHERIIASAKICIQKILTLIIIIISLPIIISDIIISCYNTNTIIGHCTHKIINLSDNYQNSNIYTKIDFSLLSYFLGDIFISTCFMVIIYYFINIENQGTFCFKFYKNILRLSILLVLLEIVWIILGSLTVIYIQLNINCKSDIIIFTYTNIVTRGILIIILSCIIINNYYVLLL